MSKRQRRTGGGRITDNEVTALVAAARADITAILTEILDDDAGLARIYAVHGQPEPQSGGQTPPAQDDEGGEVRAVCDRIAMLETTLAQAARRDGPSMQSAFYLTAARQFLFELRSGLGGRTLAAEDAFRLLFTVRHDLEEANRTLRAERRLPLAKPALTRLSELHELTEELAAQMDTLTDQVMRLFGHSNDPAVVPAPQH